VAWKTFIEELMRPAKRPSLPVEKTLRQTTHTLTDLKGELPGQFKPRGLPIKDALPVIIQRLLDGSNVADGASPSTKQRPTSRSRV